MKFYLGSMKKVLILLSVTVLQQGILFANVDSLIVQNYLNRVKELCGSNVDSVNFYLDAAENTSIAMTDNCNALVEVLLARADCAGYGIYLNEIAKNLKRAEAILGSLNSEHKFLKARYSRQINHLWKDYYYELGDFDRSLSYCRTIEDEILNTYNYLESDVLNELKFTALYFASNYFKKENYESAINYYYQSTLYEKMLAELLDRKPDFGYIYAYLAPVFQAKEEPDSAKYYYLNALDYLNRGKKYITTCHGLSSLYREQNQLDSSEWILKHSFSYHESENDPFWTKTSYQLGLTLLEKENFDGAIHYFNHSIKIQSILSKGKKNYQIAQSYIGIGDVFLNKKNWKKALENYQLALINLVHDFGDKSFLINPKLQNISSERDLLIALKKKSIALLEYFKEQDINHSDYFDASLCTAFRAIDLIDSIRIGYSSDEDKKYLIDEGYPIYNVAIELLYLKGEEYYEKAFSLAEKSKAILLFEAIRISETERNLKISPDSLEKILQIRYTLNKNQLLIDEESNITNLQKLANERLKLKKQYEYLISQLKENNPEHFRLKYDLNHISPIIVTNEMLSDDQALVEYFIYDQNAFIFVLTPNDGRLNIIKTAWNPTLSKAAATIKEDIFAQNNFQYIQKARLLYEQLVRPVFKYTSVKRLIIIPDGELWNIPFDALLTSDIKQEKQSNFKNFPYFLNEKSLIYGFSATLQHEMRKEKYKRMRGGILSFAPSYKKLTADILTLDADRDILDTLLYNIEEAEQIVQLSNIGKCIKGKSASKTNFLQLLTQNRFLHIAAHAKTNHQNPNFSYIAFTNLIDTIKESNKLYTYELYDYSLPFEMVVLSACETGTGPVWTGEGNISIARAFAYGGAKSIFTTLWSINDKATKNIMVKFYKNLKAGLTKDEALREAKLAYFQNAIDNDRAHPFYWAAFTGIGSVEPVEFKSYYQRLFFFGILLLIVCFTLLIVIFKKLNYSSILKSSVAN